MSTATTEAKNPSTSLAEMYPGKGKAKPDETIAEFRSKYTGLTISDPESEKKVRLARAEVKRVRVAVEKRRKELKADALEWGRKVDGEAKRITALLSEVEQPLIDEIKRVDDEREAAERAKIEAELEAKRKAERERIEAEQKAERERVEAQRAEMEAERRRIEKERVDWAAQRKAEAEAEAAEKAKREAEQARIEAEQAAQRAELEAERQKLEAQRQEQERIERERLQREQEELEAKERAEREAAEAEARAKREAEEAKQREIEAAAEAKRQEALLPDRDKASALAAELKLFKFPTSDDNEADGVFRDAMEHLVKAINILEAFGSK